MSLRRSRLRYEVIKMLQAERMKVIKHTLENILGELAVSNIDDDLDVSDAAQASLYLDKIISLLLDKMGGIAK